MRKGGIFFLLLLFGIQCLFIFGKLLSYPYKHIPSMHKTQMIQLGKNFELHFIPQLLHFPKKLNVGTNMET